MGGTRRAQGEEDDDQRGKRHHPHLAAHDRAHDLALLGLGSSPTAWASGSPRWSRIVWAEATRNCSADEGDCQRQQRIQIEEPFV